MTAVYYCYFSHNTDCSSVAAEMINDGFAPEVADWFTRFIPAVPGMLGKRRFRLSVEDEEAFTVDVLKNLLEAAAEARDDARKGAEFYLNSHYQPTVLIDEYRAFSIDKNGVVFEY